MSTLIIGWLICFLLCFVVICLFNYHTCRELSVLHIMSAITIGVIPILNLCVAVGTFWLLIADVWGDIILLRKD